MTAFHSDLFTYKPNQQGFTLLELVLVLFLVGLLASAGLLFTENLESQAKFDETQNRIDLIKHAIVGDLTRTVNGSSELSGFVADVGRLPLCLKELIELGAEVGSTGIEFESPCANNPEFNLTIWQIDSTSGVGAGWRGPYIQARSESDGERRFRDGYANGNDLGDNNFGWNWAISTGASAVELTTPASAIKASHISLSSDGFDTNDAGDYIPRNGEYFVTANDWLYPDGTSTESRIRINLQLSPALSNTPITVNATLVRPEVNSAFLSMPISASSLTLSASSVTYFNEDIIFPQAIPMGRYGFRLSCSSPSQPSLTCVPENYLLTVLPRQTLAPIDFRVVQ